MALLPRKLSQKLKDGDIVKVICTDPLAEADFKHYCEQSKYDFLDCKIQNEILFIRFKFNK